MIIVSFSYPPLPEPPKQSPHLDRAYSNTHPVVSISTSSQQATARNFIFTMTSHSPRPVSSSRTRAAVPNPSILANSGGVGRKFHQRREKKIYLVCAILFCSSY
ncbi:hypothetical protein CI102_4290 [Trichoderma harzianum]|nr:hypothetical protein CI102_4290 [Trichoderma harzianum]